MEQFARPLRATLPPLVKASIPDSGPLILTQANPLDFWSQFVTALEQGQSIAVLNPEWPREWLDQLRDTASNFDTGYNPVFLIPTSGSSGLPKFCIHNPDTIQAAAESFNNHAATKNIRHNINVLPQYHVGGMIPIFRSASSGGKTHFADYRDVVTIKDTPFALEEASLSLVPTQLRRMLGDSSLCGILQSMGMVLIGGAACGEDLLLEARKRGIRLAPCYGSTETAALVTLLDPDAFLDGAFGVGKPLPGASISLAEDARVLVSSEANCLGYWPAGPKFNRDPLLTNDIGKLDSSGSLHILGRADRVIITGGEKVIPEVVEAAAQASGFVQDVYCFGSPDPNWGMQVELKFTSIRKGPGLEARLEAWLKDWIPPYAVPKSIVQVETILTNDMGKRIQSSDS